MLWISAAIIAVFSITFGFLVDSEVFYLLFLSLFFIAFGFMGFINWVGISDEQIKINFVRSKVTHPLNNITSIRIYSGKGRYRTQQIVITFGVKPNVDNKVSLFELAKYCKNENIDLYFIGYNKKMIQQFKDYGLAIIEI